MALGAILGLIPAIAGVAMQGNAMANQNQINWAALNETKRSNRKTEELQRSTRRDAYGNAIKYTPGVGFEVDVTPITQAILGAEQREQFSSLSEDAPRNRAARVRQDERSKMADEEFERLFNEYRYRPKTSRAAARSQATQDLMQGRRKGLDEAANMLARQLMRTGGSSQLASVFKQADDAYAGSLGDVISQGRRVGDEDYARDLAFDDKMLAEANAMASLANNAPQAGIAGNSYNSDLSGRADNALAGLTQAIMSGRDAASESYARLAQGMGQSPDMSGLANALGKINFQGSATGQQDPAQPDMNPWTKWLTTTIPMRL